MSDEQVHFDLDAELAKEPGRVKAPFRFHAGEGVFHELLDPDELPYDALEAASTNPILLWRAATADLDPKDRAELLKWPLKKFGPTVKAYMEYHEQELGDAAGNRG